MLTLQNGGNALDAAARVDAGLGQRNEVVRPKLLELHEDEVPDFDKSVAIGIRAARRTARDALAVVEENLGAGAARSCIAHAPEIIVGGNADDSVFGKACYSLPEIVGFVVVMVNGDEKPPRIEVEPLGDEVPGAFDGQFLKVIAEREIAEHLKERMVPRRIAHVIQIVMLAARADAFLRRRCAFIRARFKAREDVLELNHARIGKEQGRVIQR